MYRSGQYAEDVGIARYFVIPASAVGVARIIEELEVFDPTSHLQRMFDAGSGVTLKELIAYTIILRNTVEEVL